MNQNVAIAAAVAAAAKAGNDRLADQVQGLIDTAGTTAAHDDRRVRPRYPIPFTFRLTPLADDGTPLVDDTTTVVGKDISLSGVGFSHDQALTCRRAIVALNHPMVGRFAVEVEIIWTRPTPIGLFESGCRLIRTLDGHTVRPKG
jgi:hypothetical protein